MSDSKIPAGLSIWQVKALQEIDRLEEEKDEVLKLMAYEREQIIAAKPIKEQIRNALWLARQDMGHHNTLVADPKHDSLRELKSRKMGAEGVSDANRVRLERQAELVVKRPTEFARALWNAHAATTADLQLTVARALWPNVRGDEISRA